MTWCFEPVYFRLSIEDADLSIRAPGKVIRQYFYLWTIQKNCQLQKKIIFDFNSIFEKNAQTRFFQKTNFFFHFVRECKKQNATTATTTTTQSVKNIFSIARQTFDGSAPIIWIKICIERFDSRKKLRPEKNWILRISQTFLRRSFFLLDFIFKPDSRFRWTVFVKLGGKVMGHTIVLYSCHGFDSWPRTLSVRHCRHN